MGDPFQTPSSLLIIGSGVFGLSFAHALTRRPRWAQTRITLLDRSPAFPSLDSASIDSSRIIRPDYADPAYTALASAALHEWRRPGGPETVGGEGRYTENGFIVAADAAPLRRPDGIKTGMGYARAAYENTQLLAGQEGRDPGFVRELADRDAIARASGTGAGFGHWGYLNEGSGWADAEAAMRWLHGRVVATGRVEFVSGAVERLRTKGRRVTGARLVDGRELDAELVMVAAGAWTGSLVDLRGQAVATGQVLGYIGISEEEQAKLGSNPTLMNMTNGIFMIPPSKNVLKIGRHAYGYTNPRKISTALVVPGEDGTAPSEISVSVPHTHLDDTKLQIPAEGERALRKALRDMVPGLCDRPWSNTRICWYSDTATGDFLITYHPYWEGLFVATGGSGHGFKFLPVLGDSIADTVEGRCPVDFQDKWCWRKASEKAILTEDGSRGGRPGLILQEELRKSGIGSRL